ncbi:NYN domain-containing protein [Gammaproteobacteria bacterium]|nr:NYN domain-containing protein [Gammaproteobacteria bacterium]
MISISSGRKSPQDSTVIKTIAYAVDRDDEKQKHLRNIPGAIGFVVELKPVIQRVDGPAKGDWDTVITLDAIEYPKYLDVVVLVSVDGDFDLLVDKIRQELNT